MGNWNCESSRIAEDVRCRIVRAAKTIFSQYGFKEALLADIGH